MGNVWRAYCEGFIVNNICFTVKNCVPFIHHSGHLRQTKHIHTHSNHRNFLVCLQENKILNKIFLASILLITVNFYLKIKFFLCGNDAMVWCGMVVFQLVASAYGKKRERERDSNVMFVYAKDAIFIIYLCEQALVKWDLVLLHSPKPSASNRENINGTMMLKENNTKIQKERANERILRMAECECKRDRE